MLAIFYECEARLRQAKTLRGAGEYSGSSWKTNDWMSVALMQLCHVIYQTPPTFFFLPTHSSCKVNRTHFSLSRSAAVMDNYRIKFKYGLTVAAGVQRYHAVVTCAVCTMITVFVFWIRTQPVFVWEGTLEVSRAVNLSRFYQGCVMQLFVDLSNRTIPQTNSRSTNECLLHTLLDYLFSKGSVHLPVYK